MYGAPSSLEQPPALTRIRLAGSHYAPIILTNPSFHLPSAKTTLKTHIMSATSAAAPLLEHPAVFTRIRRDVSSILTNPSFHRPSPKKTFKTLTMSATSAAAPSPEQPAVFTRIRLADRRDVSNIHRLIYQMAEFELLTHLFSTTESSLSSTLFPSPPLPPFRSFTGLILELSQSPISNSADDDESNLGFRPILRQIPLKSTVVDPDASTFASPRGDGIVVAGYLLCFPNYPSFMGRPGIYIEDIFVREAWRRLGMGRMMLTAVAREAARKGFARVDWCVLDWNKNAIAFYEGMGAEVSPQWNICRLAGEELDKFAVDEEESAGRL